MDRLARIPRKNAPQSRAQKSSPMTAADSLAKLPKKNRKRQRIENGIKAIARMCEGLAMAKLSTTKRRLRSQMVYMNRYREGVRGRT